MNNARKSPMNTPIPALSRRGPKASPPLLQSGAGVLAAGVLALASAAGPAYATPFSFYYNDTVSYSSISGINTGDAAKITVTLDNGGASLDSQTWTAANLQSVAFNFANGTLLTTFLTPFNGGLYTVGNFVTNASGQLTSVLSDWETGNPGTDYTTNGNAPGGWFLNGANAPVYFDNAFNKVDLNNVDSVLQASSWQAGQNPVSVPEPDTLWLILPGLAGLWLSGKCRKA